MRVLRTFSPPLTTPSESAPEPEVAGSNPAARIASSLLKAPSEPPYDALSPIGPGGSRAPARPAGPEGGHQPHSYAIVVEMC